MPHLEEVIQVIVDKVIPKPPRLVRLATIPDSYTSGNPRLLFDHEEEETAKAYPKLTSYTPAVGDRVICVRAGEKQDSWVVLGEIG